MNITLFERQNLTKFDLDRWLHGHSSNLELFRNLNTIGNHCAKYEYPREKMEEEFALFFREYVTLIFDSKVILGNIVDFVLIYTSYAIIVPNVNSLHQNWKRSSRHQLRKVDLDH